MNVSATKMGIHGEAAGDAADDQVMESVANAVRDASQSAVQHAAAIKDAICALSRFGQVPGISKHGSGARLRTPVHCRVPLAWVKTD